MPWIAAAAIIAPIVAGAIGRAASQGDRDKAYQAAQDAYDEIRKSGIPPDQSGAVLMKHFQSAGILTPQTEKDISAGVSQVSQIQEDPSQRKAQTSALNLLMQRANNGGLNAEDRMNLNRIRNQVQADAEAKQKQILQNFQQRGGGVGGGVEGAEFASELQNSQSGANRESQDADQVAAQAQQAALQAAMSGGQMASGIRAQDFNVANTKASAADQFKRFDTQNQIATQQRNVQNANQAQASNLANAQNISNANTQQDNQEKLRQLAAAHQYWIDNLNYHGALGQSDLGKAGIYKEKAGDTAGTIQGVGSGVGAGATAIGGMQQQDANRNAYLQAHAQPQVAVPKMQVPQFNGEDWQNKIQNNGNY